VCKLTGIRVSAKLASAGFTVQNLLQVELVVDGIHAGSSKLLRANSTLSFCGFAGPGAQGNHLQLRVLMDSLCVQQLLKRSMESMSTCRIKW
jgi:hypothetical protein